MSKYWIKYIAYGVIVGNMARKIWRRVISERVLSGSVPVSLHGCDPAEIRKIFAEAAQVPVAWLN
jgi:hypothetical protein